MQMMISKIPDGESLRSGWMTGLIPPEEMTVWEHAAKKISLSKKISSFPGPYDPGLNPMLNVVMHLLGPNSRVEKVVLVKGTQCGGTLIVLLLTTFVANNCPDPVMIVVSDEDERDEYSHKLTEFMNCCPDLRKKLAPLRSKSKMELIQIPGSQVHLSTATVARSLRGKHVKYLICSETSNWVKNCQGQGDPFAIALSRLDTYEGRKKIYAESTPTDPASNIDKELRKCAHQMTMYWACPHCGYYQSPDFFQDMKWSEAENEDGEKILDTDSAYLVCQNPVCEIKRIEESDKPKMLSDFKLGPVPWLEEEKNKKILSKNSKKRILRPGLESEDLLDFKDLDSLRGSVGLWYNPLQSPLGFKSWKVILKKFADSEKFHEEKQPFWNNDLGRSYDGTVSEIKLSGLTENIENYSRKPLPAGCHMLTAGVDVNGSWLSVEVTGWGRDKESWTVDYVDLPYDPAGPVAWSKLDEYLSQKYEHCSGQKLRISAVAIDSGFMTQQVASFVRKHLGSGRNIFAVKGSPTIGRPIIDKKPREYKKEINLTFYYVGTNTAKDTLSKWFEVKDPGPCYCHFGSFLPARYFKELASERLESEKKATGSRRKWVKIPGMRNEALDCRVYSLAALEYLLQVKDLNEICDFGEKKYRESGRSDIKTA